MEQHYRDGSFGSGSSAGIRAVGALLSRHFPGAQGGGNELPNEPVLL
jgi:uncharacterized membrane protein